MYAQNLRFGRIYLSLFQFWGRKRLTSLSIEYLTSFIGDWWVLVTVHKKNYNFSAIQKVNGTLSKHSKFELNLLCLALHVQGQLKYWCSVINTNWHTPSGMHFSSSSKVFLSRMALSQSALHPGPILPKVWEKVKTLNQAIKSNTRIIFKWFL